LNKEEILIEEGATCQYMYFIVSGAVTGYTMHKGKKVVTYISIENEFVSSIFGMHGMHPSKEEIMTVKLTVMIALPNNIIMELLIWPGPSTSHHMSYRLCSTIITG
jgi:signal-transduction protein with cAMP-binding, CBS, and nucleotidyltransferase domain